MGYFFEGLFLALLCTVVSSGTSKCYSCIGPQCSDPFNSSVAAIMNCSNMNTYRSSNLNELAEEEDKIFHDFNFQSVAVDDFVCSKYVYTNDYVNQNWTVRRCMPRSVDSQNICDYVNKTVGTTTGRMISCTYCETDLCNVGTLSKSSLVIVSLLFIGLSKFIS